MPAEAKAAQEGRPESTHDRRAANKSTNAVNADGLSECFRVIRTTMYVSLAPTHITNPINGIKAQHLDPLIMTYLPKARGVVLSYANVSLNGEYTEQENSTLVKVSDSSPFCFMWITVDLLIWQPQIGDILEGNVYMQASSHIGLLVHDTFNASIKLRNIPQDWQFVPNQADEFGENFGESSTEEPAKFRSYGYWADASGNKVEGKLAFTVRGIHTTRNMLSIEGTLVSPESEIDAQSVFEERRSSVSHSAPTGKHMKFSDEPIAEIAEIPETATDAIPAYEQNSEGEDTSSPESESD